MTEYPRPTRIPALDGLRGLAVLLVFAFHLPLPVFRTGSIGVIVFFVLSGFLITNLLLDDRERSGAISLRWFYLRRAVRLVPALVLVVLGHGLLQLTVLGSPDVWWSRTWPVLIYISNFVILEGTSLVHLSHTWSLAVEEHFYVLWPLLLLLVIPKWLRRVTAAVALAFIGWRLYLLTAGASNARVFFASDTNAFAPLVGCVLAVAVREKRLPTPTRSTSPMTVALLVACATLPWHFADRRLLYLAVLVALLTAVAIWAAIEAPSSWLTNPVLRWFGTISYGLYLWHYLLISLPWERLTTYSLIPMMATPLIAATASYYLVEAPLLQRLRAFESRRRSNPIPADSGEGLGIERSPAY